MQVVEAEQQRVVCDRVMKVEGVRVEKMKPMSLVLTLVEAKVVSACSLPRAKPRRD